MENCVIFLDVSPFATLLFFRCNRQLNRRLLCNSLKLIYITLLPVLEAQRVEVWPEVIGYLGHDVTLPCRFIQGADNASVTLVQWNLLQPPRNSVTIVVFDRMHGMAIHNSSLNGRVMIVGQSLTIKDVELRDAGSYMCSVATFPSGSFEGTTKLIVQEQMPLSSGMVSAIVAAVAMLLGIVAALAYLLFIRCNSSVRHNVIIDTGGTVMDVARPSDAVSEETPDVVYTAVKLSPSRSATRSSSYKHSDTMCDDVTYAKTQDVIYTDIKPTPSRDATPRDHVW
ncbi:nectin-3-like isoform X2 [Toxotes jaculatrix]|uniref:nectin-3-like isoform X2 n=1 Tax=Toxotes jaculatrix TaxID=941984 RepID=UPI001B3AA53A|nr:nectin-3-like isoform X2 [Toxotes jaculatrix]